MDVFRKTRHQILAVFMQYLSLFGVLVGGVNDRGVFRRLRRPFGGLQAVSSHPIVVYHNVHHTLIFGGSDVFPSEDFRWRAVDVASARTYIDRPFWLPAARTAESIDRLVERRSDMTNEWIEAAQGQPAASGKHRAAMADGVLDAA